jgi:PHD/YefM family antitoxin component YafN of YafNO toxin-antitoxin module
MIAITVQEAHRTLPALVQSVIADSDEALIVSDDGVVVMVNQVYWNEIKETLLLLNDPVSLASLLEGQRLRASGADIVGKSLEEVFADV